MWDVLAWSVFPAVSYFTALPLYVRCAPRSRGRVRALEWQSHVAIAATAVANAVLWSTLFAARPPTTPRASRVLVGVAIVDTVEYWMHRLLHTPALYERVHHVHHAIGVPFPSLSFVNHALDVAFTTPPILACVLACGLTFEEYCLTSALAFVATLADHVSANPRAFHTLHHCGDKRRNLEQPFFTIWDHLCGTYDERSARKIPFLVS